MDDLNAIQLALGVGGSTVAVTFLVYRLVMAMKDLFPELHGQAAVRAVYALSAVLSVMILVATGAYADVDWTPATVATALLAFVLFTCGIAEYAKGHYSNDHKVAVEGLPPSSEASVPRAAIHDPQDDARPLSHDELVSVARRSR